jgi:catechol 2,3-dioxygenase
MSDISPLWPADLDHIRYDSPRPGALAEFYASGLGMTKAPLGDGAYLLRGPGRRLIVGPGEAARQPFSAFALRDAAQLAAYRRFVEARGADIMPSPTPLFDDRNAFAVRDPDGRFAVFGLPRPEHAQPAPGAGPAASIAGRLQHVVVASSRFREMMAFYTATLGFLLSDTVHAEDGRGGLGEVTVCFLRSHVEHHSFAVFRAPVSRADHHAYETSGWNDIKLWADHFAALEVPIWWGPGRHGAGNNLFFMVKDPDGNNVEISAELELMEKDQPGKQWAGGKRAINLWGEAWIRDTDAPGAT